MQLNSFVLRIAILLLPGLIGSKLYRKLRGRTEKQSWEDLLEILLFSIVSYLIFLGAASASHRIYELFIPHQPSQVIAQAPTSRPATAPAVAPSTTSFTFQSFTDEKAPLDWEPIATSSLISVLVAFAASFVATRQIVNRFGYCIGATRRKGDACVWTIFNQNYAPPSEFQWAYVRDLKSNVVYFGQIRHFSDPGDLHELVLHDVTVFKNDDGERLYEARVLYVARNAGELSIEFPPPAPNNPIEPNKGLSDGKTDPPTDAGDQPAQGNPR